jgi:deoxyribodipyrimidine photo-lyase
VFATGSHAPIFRCADERNRMDRDGTSQLSPYFRVFNPVLQGTRFDPEGDYIRRSVPELARVPAAYLNEPWRTPASLQRSSRCIISRHYPAPIVDHAWARKRALGADRRAS